jgi:hypothetical protein
MILNVEKNSRLDDDYIDIKYRHLSPVIEYYHHDDPEMAN